MCLFRKLGSNQINQLIWNNFILSLWTFEASKFWLHSVRFEWKFLHLHFKDEQKSYGFGKTWRWVKTEFSFLGELSFQTHHTIWKNSDLILSLLVCHQYFQSKNIQTTKTPKICIFKNLFLSTFRSGLAFRWPRSLQMWTKSQKTSVFFSWGL